MNAVLNQDVYSYKYDLYGMKGDKLKVIGMHGEVLLVEGPKRITVDNNRKKELVVSGTHTYPVHETKVNKTI